MGRRSSRGRGGNGARSSGNHDPAASTGESLHHHIPMLDRYPYHHEPSSLVPQVFDITHNYCLLVGPQHQPSSSTSRSHSSGPPMHHHPLLQNGYNQDPFRLLHEPHRYDPTIGIDPYSHWNGNFRRRNQWSTSNRNPYDDGLQVPPLSRTSYVYGANQGFPSNNGGNLNPLLGRSSAAAGLLPIPLNHQHLRSRPVTPNEGGYDRNVRRHHHRHPTAANRFQTSSGTHLLHHDLAHPLPIELIDDQYIIDLTVQLPRLSIGSDTNTVNHQQTTTAAADVTSGLSEELISRHLKTRTLINAQKDSPTETEICSICQDEFEENNNIGTLDCGHEYHADCIKKWLMINNECPLCKRIGLTSERSDN